MLEMAAALHCIERSSRRVEDRDFHRANHPWGKAKGSLTSKRIDLFEILPQVAPEALLSDLIYLSLLGGKNQGCFTVFQSGLLHLSMNG